MAKENERNKSKANGRENVKQAVVVSRCQIAAEGLARMLSGRVMLSMHEVWGSVLSIAPPLKKCCRKSKIRMKLDVVTTGSVHSVGRAEPD